MWSSKFFPSNLPRPRSTFRMPIGIGNGRAGGGPFRSSAGKDLKSRGGKNRARDSLSLSSFRSSGGKEVKFRGGKNRVGGDSPLLSFLHCSGGFNSSREWKMSPPRAHSADIKSSSVEGPSGDSTDWFFGAEGGLISPAARVLPGRGGVKNFHDSAVVRGTASGVED